MDSLALLRKAREAALEVRVDGEKLVIRGPKSAEALAKELLDHKPEILAHLCSPRQQTDSHDELIALQALRDTVRVEWNRLFDLLETLDQQSRRFQELFAAWQLLDIEYKQLCDRVNDLSVRQTSEGRECQPVLKLTGL